ncbi:MAG: Kelch repeat-containing protein, partial [Woeseiaceae bacterium]
MMKRFLVAALLLAINMIATAGQGPARLLPPLPEPVTNNAVVSLRSDGTEFLISFAGLGKDRGHADTLDVTYVFDGKSRQWKQADALPGGVGRLASVAVAAGSLAYVFGGYAVAADGTEVSTVWAHSFDPVSGEFEELEPMPVPVDDAVAVTYQDRYIYLISGWHDLGNVNLV